MLAKISDACGLACINDVDLLVIICPNELIKPFKWKGTAPTTFAVFKVGSDLS